MSARFAVARQVGNGNQRQRHKEETVTDHKSNLQQTVDICRAAEATDARHESLKCEDIHSIRSARNVTKSYRDKRVNSSDEIECLFCGSRHARLKSKCPAWGKTCSKCSKRNHFAIKCRNSGDTNVHAVNEVDSDIESINTVHAVDNGGHQIYGEVNINDFPVRIQIDSGATVNVIPKRYIRDNHVTPTSTVLQMWNKTRVIPVGEAKVELENPANNKRYKVKFIVVNDDSGIAPLLGSKASQRMNIITINTNNLKQVATVASTSVLDSFGDVFGDELGTLPGVAHFEIDSCVTPVVAATRRVPVALHEPLKSELNKLQTMNVIEEPTDWVSNVVVARKKNGDLRICIDPHALNKALKRERYQLPTLEDILPELLKARVFSAIDLKSGYWHVSLDEASSLLTTFSTPYGRYRWLRMPFGCNVSSEIFQKKPQQAIEGLEGVHCVADDIMLYGVGCTDDEAIADHDTKLQALLQRCRDVGIRLNNSKIKLRQKSLTFLGHLVTDKGLKPDPEKVKAIEAMPPPTDMEGVQRLNGFVNYLAKFLPKLSETMEPIRQLMRNDVPWNWAAAQQRAFEDVKKLVTNAPILSYYDSKKPLMIQCDASEKGLGAALLQEAQPIAFASRALTDPETRYAQIEKEMPAIVFAAEKFDQYTFGHSVTVQSDHKPWESILKKPLFSTPKRLQGMIMRLHRYNLEVVYTQGKLLYLADTPSRAFLSTNQVSGPQDGLEHISMVQYLPITEQRLQQIKEYTSSDEHLQQLRAVIMDGWPTEKKDLPHQVATYFPYRDELSVQDGLVFRGERVVIPTDLRQTLKERVHSSNLGIEGCLRRARECLFWPNMNADLKEYISACSICRSHETSQQRETLKPHDVPDRPWAKVGTDLFSISDTSYLIVVDYYSNFWEVDKLDNTDSVTVIKNMKTHFARYGIPDQVVSDNGPQYTSHHFANFSRTWDFEHITSSPGHSQSNGMAESAVKTAKRIIKRAKESKSDVYLAILDHRNTPKQSTRNSPAQSLMNRRTKTLLPTTASLLVPKLTYGQHAALQNRKRRQAWYHDRHARDLQPLREGDVVRMKPFQKHGRHEWKQGVVSKRLDERSYNVETATNTYRRNRVHLRRSTEQPQAVTVHEAAADDHTDGTNRSMTVVTPPEPVILREKTATLPTTALTTPQRATIVDRAVTRSGRAVNRPARYEE